MRITRILITATTALALVGCGGATKTVTQTASGSSSTTTGSNARSQNDQVISSAGQATDNQAALGAAAIRKVLVTKIGLDKQDSFNLNHHITPADIAQDTGDCYVKLGADAVNSEDQTDNILRSPNGADVVFVQSDTTTPLVGCLKDVKSALSW